MEQEVTSFSIYSESKFVFKDHIYLIMPFPCIWGTNWFAAGDVFCLTVENIAEYRKQEKDFYLRRKYVLSSCPRNKVYVVCDPFGLLT